jgi:hypothetical protein
MDVGPPFVKGRFCLMCLINTALDVQVVQVLVVDERSLWQIAFIRKCHEKGPAVAIPVYQCQAGS